MIPHIRSRRTLTTLCLALGLTHVCTLHAQVNGPMPTLGTELWTGFMQNAYGAQELRLLITAPTATTGTVSMPQAGWSQPFSVNANGVTQVVLPNTAEHMGSEQVLGKGVRIQAVDPVAVTAVSYQSYTQDGAQVLPVHALGTDHFAEAYRGLPGFNDYYKSELLIVATADGTEVEITPSVNTSGGRPAGVPFTVMLDEGQSYQVQSALASLDLTGTRVRGTAQSGPCRPFAVLSGSMCANVPLGCPACDHIVEQMVPLERWGTSFHTFMPGGITSTTLRVLAGQNGTNVTVNGGAPVLLNAGQTHELNGINAPACINATAPVSVVLIYEGYNCANAGDPSMVVIEPDDRTTLASSFGTSSGQINVHRVELVVPSAAVGQVTVDGSAVPASSFATYAACPGWSHASRVIGAGTHRVTAPQGIHVYATGFGTGESYAYSANATIVPEDPPDSLLCVNGPVTLTSPVPLDNPHWEASSTPGVVLATGISYNFIPTTNASYTVQGLVPGTTCPLEFTFHVGPQVPANLDALADNGGSAVICQYMPVQLGASPVLDPATYDLAWTPAGLVNDPGIPNPIAYPLGTTWFRLQVTSPLGCGTVTDSVLVQVVPNDVLRVKATVADDQICLGDAVQLGAQTERIIAQDPLDNGTSTLWSQLQGGAVSATCGSVAGSALLFTGAGTRLARTVAADVAQGGSLAFSIWISAGGTPCDGAEPGEDVVVEYSLNGTTWAPIVTFLESQYPVFTAVDLPIPPAAWSPATLFRWRQLANSGASQDVWALDNVLMSSVDNSGLALQWNPVSSLNDPTVASPTATPAGNTWYTVTVTGASGCSFSDSVLVQVAPAFSVSTGPDTLICGSGQVQLQATAANGQGIQWNWTPPNSGLSDPAVADPVAVPSATTAYIATATNSLGCSASDTVTVTVGPALGLIISATDTALCQGQSTQLSALVQGSANVTWQWNNSGSLDDPTVAGPIASPTSTTSYTAIVTDVQSGCSADGTISVMVTTTYTIDAGADTSLCSTIGHQLGVQHNVPAPFTIAWTPANLLGAGNSPSPVLLADTTMLFAVTVTDAIGCSVTDAVMITDAFDGLVTPVDTAGCQGQNLLLDAGFPGSAYAWSHGPVAQVVAVSTAGTYQVEILDALGCQSTLTFNVVVNPSPAIDLGPDSILCGASAFSILANSAGNAVVWGNGTAGQQFLATASGTYMATATTVLGCSATDSVALTFAPLPVDVLQDTMACSTTLVILDAGNTGSTHAWSTGATTQAVAATTSGPYSVLVTTPLGCSSTMDAWVELVVPPPVELGPDTALCAGSSLILDAEQPGCTYAWSTGASTPAITVAQGGAISLVVTNGACMVHDTITISLLPAPVDELADVTACIGQPVLLDAGNAGSTYAWNTGAVTAMISPTTAGTYAVTVTTTDGCSGSFDAVVSLLPWPVVELGPDTTLCDGDLLLLGTSDPGLIHTWSTGAGTPTITVTNSGTYTVMVDNGYCSATDAITALFEARPDAVPERERFTCLDEEPHHVLLDAGNPGASYAWSTGEVAQVIVATSYGWYVVDVTNAEGCTLRDSVRVNEFCPATIYVPNTFTPNGDGINDTWGTIGRNVVELEVTVFDRWGGVLWRATTMDDRWDGTARGSEAPNDLYVWKMRYRLIDAASGVAGMPAERTGHVQVLR